MNKIENFIRIYKTDLKLCDDLIQYHKDNVEYKGQGISLNAKVNKDIKESIDVNFYNQSSNKTILEFFKILSKNVQEYMNEFNIIYNLRTAIMNKIQYYPPNGGFKIFHTENTDFKTIRYKLVYMLYLNNVKNGGTEFKYQKIKLDAIKGNFIIWPADFTHLHKSIVSTTEEKYITTGWLEME